MVWLWVVVGAMASAPDRPLDPAGSRYFKVRVAAAQALSGRLDEASRTRLRALATDDHPLVREAARRTLGGP